MISIQWLFIFLPIVAAEVRTDFVSDRPWYAGYVKNHYITGENGCMAYTLGDRRRARLEVYALKDEEQYIVPTVQIAVDNYELITEARLKVGRKVFRMTRATYPEGYGDVQAVMVRYSEREELIELLKAGQLVEVSFLTRGGRIFRRVEFSLTNSSDVIGKFERRCRLGR